MSIERELAALREEIASLRAEVRALRGAAPPLVAVLEEYFGEGRFTAAGILQLCEEEPHSQLAEAVAATVDMNSPTRAVQLGSRLARMPGIEPCAKSHGCILFRVALPT